MIGEELKWATGTGTLHGKPVARSIASTPDARTTIEIIGPPRAIKQIVVVGQMVDEDSAKQAATYMAIAVRLILPQWDGADAWLAAGLRNVKAKPQTISVHGWRVGVQWMPDLQAVGLQATR